MREIFQKIIGPIIIILLPLHTLWLEISRINELTSLGYPDNQLFRSNISGIPGSLILIMMGVGILIEGRGKAKISHIFTSIASIIILTGGTVAYLL